jgi:hypothetical protein
MAQQIATHNGNDKAIPKTIALGLIAAGSAQRARSSDGWWREKRCMAIMVNGRVSPYRQKNVIKKVKSAGDGLAVAHGESEPMRRAGSARVRWSARRSRNLLRRGGSQGRVRHSEAGGADAAAPPAG